MTTDWSKCMVSNPRRPIMYSDCILSVVLKSLSSLCIDAAKTTEHKEQRIQSALMSKVYHRYDSYDSNGRSIKCVPTRMCHGKSALRTARRARGNISAKRQRWSTGNHSFSKVSGRHTHGKENYFLEYGAMNLWVLFFERYDIIVTLPTNFHLPKENHSRSTYYVCTTNSDDHKKSWLAK